MLSTCFPCSLVVDFLGPVLVISRFIIGARHLSSTFFDFKCLLAIDFLVGG